jgi:YHS domain-containing protein
MNGRTKMLCAFSLALACSPAFAADGGGRTGRHPAVRAAKAREAKAVSRKVTAEEAGKEAVCPVTGEKFKVTGETVSVSYKGGIYYFCCPACKKSFLQNPGKYLQKKQEPQAKIYVCPMGDYAGEKPGKCPRCGMDLVEKK